MSTVSDRAQAYAAVTHRLDVGCISPREAVSDYYLLIGEPEPTLQAVDVSAGKGPTGPDVTLPVTVKTITGRHITVADIQSSDYDPSYAQLYIHDDPDWRQISALDTHRGVRAPELRKLAEALIEAADRCDMADEGF